MVDCLIRCTTWSTKWLIDSHFGSSFQCCALAFCGRLARHVLPSWINDGLNDFKLMPVAPMAGRLLRAVARTLAGGVCSSHSAAVPLLPPSTPRTPSPLPLVAMPLLCSCRTTWSSSRASTLLWRALLSLPGWRFRRGLREDFACRHGVFHRCAGDGRACLFSNL